MADSSVISITVTTKVTSTTFTGTINSQGIAGTGTTLTVTAGTSVCIGMILTGGSIQAGTIITAGSGTTWTVSIAQSITSTSITGTISTLNVNSIPSGFGNYAGWLTGWSISGGSVTSSVIGQYITSSPNATVATYLPAYALGTTQVTPVTTQVVTARYTDPLGSKSNVLQAGGIFSGWITSTSSRDIIGIITIDSPQTEENFLLPGTYSWYPSGSLTASILCIGGGAGGTSSSGGGGGGLAYVNNFVLGAGPYTVVVGAGGSPNSNGGDTYILNNSYTLSGSDTILVERFQVAGQVELAGNTTANTTTTWSVPNRFVTTMSAVVIGGGGSSGHVYTSASNVGGGGGGGGGGLSYIGSTSVSLGQTYTLTAGRGGNANGVAGGTSTLKNGATTLASALGGAYGLLASTSYQTNGAGLGSAGGGGAGGYNGVGGGGAGSTGTPPGIAVGGTGGTGTNGTGGRGGQGGYADQIGNVGASVSDNISAGNPTGDGEWGGAYSRGNSTSTAGALSFDVTANFLGGASPTITVTNYGGGTIVPGQIFEIRNINYDLTGISATIVSNVGTNQWSISRSFGSVTGVQIRVWPGGYGLYGGGGGNGSTLGIGAPGGVRLIYGLNRNYPSTNTLDQTVYMTNLTVPSALAAGLTIGMPIKFNFSIGSISANTIYYVYYVNGTDVQLVSDNVTTNSSGYGNDYSPSTVGTITSGTITWSSIKAAGGGNTVFNSVATLYNTSSGSVGAAIGGAGNSSGGGGAGGYGTAGGAGGANGGSSGGGGGGTSSNGGGGVGIYGQDVSGSAGGYGGSKGFDSISTTGGFFGGGGGVNGTGAGGGIRIIWGSGRYFPNTLTSAINTPISGSGRITLTSQIQGLPSLPLNTSVILVSPSTSNPTSVRIGSNPSAIGKGLFQIDGYNITYIQSVFGVSQSNVVFPQTRIIVAKQVENLTQTLNPANNQYSPMKAIIANQTDIVGLDLSDSLSTYATISKIKSGSQIENLTQTLNPANNQYSPMKSIIAKQTDIPGLDLSDSLSTYATISKIKSGSQIENLTQTLSSMTSQYSPMKSIIAKQTDIPGLDLSDSLSKFTSNRTTILTQNTNFVFNTNLSVAYLNDSLTLIRSDSNLSTNEGGRVGWG